MWSNGQSVVYTQCLFLEGLGLSVHTINQVHYSITTFATVCSDTWNVIVQSRLCLTGSLSPLRRGHPRGSKEALEGKNCAEGSLCCGHSRRNPKHTCKKCIHSFLRQMTLSLVINFTLIPFTWPPWWLKNLPARQETQVQSLSQEDPLEKGMATHSSILGWRIPRTEEPGGLQSTVPGGHKEWDTTEWLTLSSTPYHSHAHYQEIIFNAPCFIPESLSITKSQALLGRSSFLSATVVETASCLSQSIFPCALWALTLFSLKDCICCLPLAERDGW